MKIIEGDVSRIVNSIDSKFLQGKDVLITGASGMMGVYFTTLFQELQNRGIGPSKIFLSTLSGNFPNQISNSVEVIHGNLATPSTIEVLPCFDIIIHAAGYAQPQKFLEDPLLTIALNTSVTINLLSKVKQGGKFLFMSTSEVYSGLEAPPFFETQIGKTNTNHPRSAYIEGKRCGEAIISAANSTLKLTGSSCRLSLAYGPGTKSGDSRALNTFIHQALTSQKISMMDFGQAWRTYCYVLDAIEMCLDVLSAGSGGIYNIAGKSRIQVIGLAKTIADLTGARVVLPRKKRENALAGAPSDVWLNTEKVLALKGKSNFIGLREGLTRTIEWQKTM